MRVDIDNVHMTSRRTEVEATRRERSHDPVILDVGEPEEIVLHNQREPTFNGV